MSRNNTSYASSKTYFIITDPMVENFENVSNGEKVVKEIELCYSNYTNNLQGWKYLCLNFNNNAKIYITKCTI